MDMPNGVSIIKKEEIVETNFKSWVIFVWLIGVVLSGILILLFADEKLFTIKNVILATILCIWGAGYLPLTTKCSFAWKTISTGKYLYTVTIDESVPFTDLENYVVSKNEDGTYLLKEKNQ